MEDDGKQRPRRAHAQAVWVQANGHIVSESAALKRALKESLLESKKSEKNRRSTSRQQQEQNAVRDERIQKLRSSATVTTSLQCAFQSGVSKQRFRRYAPSSNVTDFSNVADLSATKQNAPTLSAAPTSASVFASADVNATANGVSNTVLTNNIPSTQINNNKDYCSVKSNGRKTNKSEKVIAFKNDPSAKIVCRSTAACIIDGCTRSAPGSALAGNIRNTPCLEPESVSPRNKPSHLCTSRAAVQPAETAPTCAALLKRHKELADTNESKMQVEVSNEQDSSFSAAPLATIRKHKMMKFRRDFLEDTMRESARVSPRKKFCAQRKFAQTYNAGSGFPWSPSTTPIKAPHSHGASPQNASVFPPPPLILPAAATQTTLPLKPTCKTEDFLTFLCLRGTALCPEDLKFLEHPATFEVSRIDERSSASGSGVSIPMPAEKASRMRAKATKRNISEIGACYQSPRILPQSKVVIACDSNHRSTSGKDFVKEVARLIAAKYKKNMKQASSRESSAATSQRMSTRHSSSDSFSSASISHSRAERLRNRRRRVAQIEKENKRRPKAPGVTGKRLLKSRTSVRGRMKSTGDSVRKSLLEVNNAANSNQDSSNITVAQRRSALIYSQNRRSKQNAQSSNVIARSLVRRAKTGKATQVSINVNSNDSGNASEQGRRATRSLGPIAEVALPIWPKYMLKQYELSLSRKKTKSCSSSVAMNLQASQHLPQSDKPEFTHRLPEISHSVLASVPIHEADKFVPKEAKRISKRRSERLVSCDFSSVDSSNGGESLTISLPRKTISRKKLCADKPRTIAEAVTSVDVNDRIDNLEPISSTLVNTSTEESSTIKALMSCKFDGGFESSAREILNASSTNQDTPVKPTLNFMSDCGSPSGSVISRASDASYLKVWFLTQHH